MKPSYIILHHSLTADSETVSWGAIRNYHVKTLHWSDIGYHYGIELIKDKHEILVGRMMDEPGAHCRQNGMNRHSLGICFIGNFDHETPPLEMWMLGLDLVNTLMKVFNIPRDNIYAHRELATYKSCPGWRFNINKFRNSVYDK